MTWINTSLRFNDRIRVFTIGRKELLTIASQVLDAMSIDSPAYTEQMLLQLIETARPDLSGCVLTAFNYNICANRWELCVSHASFDAVPDGREPPRESLRKDDQK